MPLITNREFNLTMEEGDFDVILRCCMENSSYQSSFVAPVTLVNYLTRQLELEFSWRHRRAAGQLGFPAGR